MCNYFSGIITQNGEVLWLKENPVNHEAIIEAYNLKDTKLDDREFVRFEIQPKSISELLKVKLRSELTRDLFTFRWDEESTLPGWVEKDCAKLIAKAWLAAEESWKIHYLFGEECIKELKEKGYIHLMWGNAQILDVYGNAKISDVRDNAQISDVYGNAQISDVRDNAQISDVYGNAKISDVRDNAKISDVYGNAQISHVYDNAQISDVYGNAQISHVYDNAQISHVRDNAQISHVRDNAQILDVYGNAQIENMTGFATVVKNGILIVAKDCKVKKAGKVVCK